MAAFAILSFPEKKRTLKGIYEFINTAFRMTDQTIKKLAEHCTLYPVLQ